MYPGVPQPNSRARVKKKKVKSMTVNEVRKKCILGAFELLPRMDQLEVFVALNREMGSAYVGKK